MTNLITSLSSRKWYKLQDIIILIIFVAFHAMVFYDGIKLNTMLPSFVSVMSISAVIICKLGWVMLFTRWKFVDYRFVIMIALRRKLSLFVWSFSLNPAINLFALVCTYIALIGFPRGRHFTLVYLLVLCLIYYKSIKILFLVCALIIWKFELYKNLENIKDSLKLSAIAFLIMQFRHIELIYNKYTLAYFGRSLEFLVRMPFYIVNVVILVLFINRLIKHKHPSDKSYNQFPSIPRFVQLICALIVVMIFNPLFPVK
jgi:hypothetical protein